MNYCVSPIERARDSVHASRGRPFPHRDEFLSRRGMNRNRRIELSLGRAALECNCQALDYLARIGADHVTADHAIGLSIDDQLHEGTLIAAAHRMFQRTEARLVDIDFTVPLTRLGLGQPDRPDGRLTEYR